MRTIRLVCTYDGDVTKYDLDNDVFSNENEEIEIVVSYPTEYNAYRKRVDIFVEYDKSIDYLEDDATNEVTFTLTSEYLKQGKIKIQPIAYLVEVGKTYLQSKKQKWKVVSFNIDYSLNVSESTTNVSDTLGQVLQAEIDDLQEQIDNLDLSDKMDIDGLNSNIDELHFDTTPSSTDALLAGQMRYSASDGTVLLGMNGGQVNQSIGLELYYRVKNNSGVTINNGQLVMANGTDGNSGVINVKKWDTTSNQFYIMGLATEEITNGDLGFVTWFGKIMGVQSNGANYGETWVDGELLYPSTTIQGGLTKVATSDMPIAMVINSHGSNGQIFARIR